MKLSTLILTIGLFFSLHAETVDEILDKMEKNENPKSSKAEATMIVHTTSGQVRESKLVMYGKDEGDKSLMEYISPARIKGMKILMLNDGKDIWLYSPRTSRVRKLASRQRKQSVNGSDFSYEDMSMRDMREDYNSKLLGNENLDEKDCYKIEMTAKDEDKTYSRVVMWVDKSNYTYQKGEFYDEDKELWKTLELSGFTKKAKYWTAKMVEMKNIQKGSKTIIKTDKTEYDIELKDDLFSERNLKR